MILSTFEKMGSNFLALTIGKLAGWFVAHFCFLYATFLVPEKLLVLRLLPMNTSVPSAIAHVHNMVMAIWIITRGEVEQIPNAVHLPAVLKLLKMREQGLSCSSNLVCAVRSCCTSPISMLFSALW